VRSRAVHTMPHTPPYLLMQSAAVTSCVSWSAVGGAGTRTVRVVSRHLSPPRESRRTTSLARFAFG
jgi:hypothetical protein